LFEGIGAHECRCCRRLCGNGWKDAKSPGQIKLAAAAFAKWTEAEGLLSKAALEARASISRYLGFYNGRRPHLSLDGTTPDQAYFNSLPLRSAA
jgi:hypothetical protein